MTQADRLAIHLEYEAELARMLVLANTCAVTTARLVATMKGTKS